MLFSNRIWCLTEVPSSKLLAEMLTLQTWCCCAGFFVRGHRDYLFLNDATSGDGAQEYGVLKRAANGRLWQFESITFSWCSTERAKVLIDECLFDRCGEPFDFGSLSASQIETPEQHAERICPLCA